MVPWLACSTRRVSLRLVFPASKCWVPGSQISCVRYRNFIGAISDKPRSWVKSPGGDAHGSPPPNGFIGTSHATTQADRGHHARRGSSMRQVLRVWPIAGRTPGEPVGLVIGTSAPTGPGWEAPAEEMDCSEEKATSTAHPSNYAGSDGASSVVHMV